ncbi:hypothetical protein [Clostridium estertheticum]|uniref:hypothetical protein n=1 Tax=Clostridium estertheticum TaxID=238834 RepID=UPI001C7CA05D|nr:hypothetical protein [Clostridium estertheticum]MBX4271459.1 hypothetical protein [Clostridium estertheticum]WLC81012.1 hypothetical protein KTC98_07250 [Clostridium estertheticum]
MEIEVLVKSYVVNIDLIKGIDFPTIKFTRNDNANQIIFNITNNVKEVFLDNKTVTVNIRKLDNTKVIYGTKIKNNQAIWDLDLNGVACLGLVVVTVEVYEGSTRLTSEKFNYTVGDEIGGIKVDSSSELPVLTQLIADVNSTKVEANELNSTLTETMVLASNVRVQLDKSIALGTPVKGDTGEKGADGYIPIKGVDYTDGATGNTNITGAIGQNGVAGYTSIKGTDYNESCRSNR